MSSALENSFADGSWLACGLTLRALLADHLLVGCRLLGLLITVPGCNPSVVPWQTRALLLVVLAGMITPNVSLSARGALRPAAPPPRAMHHTENSIRPVAHEPQISIDEVAGEGHFTTAVRSPGSIDRSSSVVNFLALAAGEACLGFLLGIGANLIMQGFRMAGQLIDQQTGLGMVSSAGIDCEEGGSILGELLFWIGNMLLILLGGHLLLVSTVLETFRTFPPGSGSAPLEIIPVAAQLIQQSLSLALQLSAPVIAAQIVVGLIVTQAGSVAPQFQNVGAASVLKLVVALGVLTLALTGTMQQLIELIPGTQQTVLQAIHR